MLEWSNGSSLIIVTGPPRSGTTLLNRQLCEPDHVGPFLPECSFLTQVIAQYSNIVNFSDERRFSAYFGSRGACRKCFEACVGVHLAQVKSRLSGQFKTLVLKDPNLCLYAAEAKELFPDGTRFVFMIRDPRAVIASMKDVSAKREAVWEIEAVTAEIFNYYFRIHHAVEMADLNFHFLRYEDLVRGAVADLERFVGYDVPTESHSDIEDSLDRSDPFFSELYVGPVSEGKVDSWRNTLDSDEVAHVESVFSGVMFKWGYPPATIS